jgi:hypothetical protein
MIYISCNNGRPPVTKNFTPLPYTSPSISEDTNSQQNSSENLKFFMEDIHLFMWDFEFLIL